MNTISNIALEKYTDLIIKKINEVSENDWEKPWFNASFVGSPQNLSGNKYHAFNKVLLYAICDQNKYSTPVFLTFNQAQQQNIRILKNAKSFPITYWNLYIKHQITGENITREFYEKLSLADKAAYKTFPVQKFYNVFNLDQTTYAEVYPEQWNILHDRFNAKIGLIGDKYTNPLIDKTIENQTWLCPIKLHPQNEAYYSTTFDKIVLPTMEQFPEGKSFYHTALHEMAHSTGAPNRLNRVYGSLFGDEKYAREELIAELSSAVTGRDIGLSILPRSENAKYLKYWLGNLNKEPKYIMSLLQEVGKATAMIEATIGFEKVVNEAISLQNDGDFSQSQFSSLNPSIMQTIHNQNSAISDIIKSGSSVNYNIKNIEIESSGARSLLGDITISSRPDKCPSTTSEFRIHDKSTGLTEPLQPNGINLGKESPETIKQILSGAKTNTSSGLVQLSKSVTGWGITVVKQAFATTDASAGI